VIKIFVFSDLIFELESINIMLIAAVCGWFMRRQMVTDQQDLAGSVGDET